MRVSWLTGWPSAVTEIQEVSVARMTSVKVAADFPDGWGFDFGNERTVTSLLSLTLSVASTADRVAGDAAVA